VIEKWYIRDIGWEDGKRNSFVVAAERWPKRLFDWAWPNILD